VTQIKPRSVFDAGCAFGFLVESLRDRGVDAYGVDVSEYAIGQVRDDIKPYCRVGSVTDELDRDFDLITCIEVLEHVDADTAQRAIDNFCRHTADVLFSSTPTDYTEPTHQNVRATAYWAGSFARRGFLRDVDFDAEPILFNGWATRFRRNEEPLERVVAGYERLLWRLKDENHQLRQASRERAELASQMAARDARINALEGEVAAMRSTRAWRVAEQVRRLRPKRP
jgi:2-polyprenyl-3-methyl-5-hydroxy-6-metoxy-1,4-benzoquinol methylase